MRGYRLRKIRTVEDLKEVGFGWILDEVPFHVIEGSYVESDTETEFEPVEEVEVPYAIIVHGRLFLETASAYKDKNGELYITDEELERHL